ncbi:TadE/TadG family type IV pilus assembly protein [Phenylobacterium sp.]|uniref:TadE/TadG family type IV pilus assembly protein n=1 Tax=Phenylobacterium sp. TaxID=1871053 RepID=UPI002731D5A6|nr:TadE/TadG family type IV pilus assembly protein [Phenylobacterium sp.]MDP1601286.1 pilus assembly protein [Phenylobacterium sp.]MDP3590244.1 pilus assembly protein [Phenylobacterium sp.]
MQYKDIPSERLLSRLKAQLQVKLKAGLRDERGATAVFFAVGLVLLAPAALGLVDVYLTTTQRAELQDALDTATLYAARSDKMTDAELKTVGQAALVSNLRLPEGQKLVSSDFKLAADKITVVGTAQIEAPGVGPKLWERADLTANSEVLRNSNNVEVALVLDTTGSMSANMANLRTAANDLVTLVIKDQQKPYYTKVALVPYAVGVNVGSLADAARGVLVGPVKISSIALNGTRVEVTTSTPHALVTGDRVLLASTGKSITPSNGSKVSLDAEYVVTWRADNKFSLDGVTGALSGTLGSSAASQCLQEGCKQYSFVSASNNARKLFASTNCVSERVGSEAYTDAGPGVAGVGRLYQPPSNLNNPCSSAAIMPLTSSKDLLKQRIDGLTDSSSTAGQIGLAWGWYMVSPEWGSFVNAVSADSVPAPYNKPQTLKVVILMTDGAFNTPYCKGVIASDAGSGSGNASDHIKCSATNGDPFAQADKLCKNIKEKGVFIYTVGFNVGSDAKVKKLMNDCATSAEYVYMPANGTQLKVAFRAIAQDINSLRISK